MKKKQYLRLNIIDLLVEAGMEMRFGRHEICGDSSLFVF